MSEICNYVHKMNQIMDDYKFHKYKTTTYILTAEDIINITK